jgi:hypothetical protein
MRIPHNQSYGEDRPRREVVFPRPIHYAATAGNVTLLCNWLMLSSRKKSMSVPVWELEVAVNLEVSSLLATPHLTSPCSCIQSLRHG